MDSEPRRRLGNWFAHPDLPDRCGMETRRMKPLSGAERSRIPTMKDSRRSRRKICRTAASFWLALVLAGSPLDGNTDARVLGPFGGDVRSLAVHPGNPDTYYLGTADGQIYISRDSGLSWSRIVPGLGRRDLVVDNLAFDPKDPSTLYAATWELKAARGQLFRSPNGGRKWEPLSTGRYDSTIRAMAIAPSDPAIIAIGILEGVLLSRDRGQTWDRITRGYRSLYNVDSLAFDDQDPPTLYVGTFHLAWKTSNFGRKWVPIHKGMASDSDLFAMVVEPGKPDIIYAGACSGIYKSDNGGEKWFRLKNGLPKEARRTRALHMDPSDPATLYAGTTKGLFVTRDSGRSWKQLISGVVLNAVAVHPNQPSMILVGSDDAGILRSDDGGASFTPSNRGFVHRQIGALEPDPRRSQVYFASVVLDRNYGGFFTLNGRSWKLSAFNDGLDGSADSIRAIRPSRLSSKVYLGTGTGLFVGVPDETPWARIGEISELPVLDLSFSDRQETGLYLATRQGVFHLDLETGSLEKREISADIGAVHTLLYDVPSATLFAGTDSGLFRSRDGGGTWLVPPRGLPAVRVNIVGRSGPRLFCGTGKGVFVSDGRGDEWRRASGVQALDIAALSVTGGGPDARVFASDSLLGHLYASPDGGNNWHTIDRGSSGPRITALYLSTSGELLAGTLSEGIHLIHNPVE